MIPEATHQKILLKYINLTNKPILEIGAGNSSTRLIHENCTNQILTIDDNMDWLIPFYDLKSDRHKFQMYSKSNFKAHFDSDTVNWGLVFIDASTWDIRKYAIEKYVNVDYVMIHDGDYMLSAIIHSDKFSKLYKYWKEFNELIPSTIVASNIVEI